MCWNKTITENLEHGASKLSLTAQSLFLSVIDFSLVHSSCDPYQCVCSIVYLNYYYSLIEMIKRNSKIKLMSGNP